MGEKKSAFSGRLFWRFLTPPFLARTSPPRGPFRPLFAFFRKNAVFIEKKKGIFGENQCFYVKTRPF
jgi:hypothetical protein